VTSDEVLRAYAVGRRDFRAIDLEPQSPDQAVADFSHQTLDDADFSGAFVVAHFKCASLRRTRFVGSNLKTCTFDGANLTEADLSGAALCATTFADAVLDGARFEGASYHSHVLGPRERPDW
jgi:uncharacterized protein YjbI with pentapeptide repeats